MRICVPRWSGRWQSASQWRGTRASCVSRVSAPIRRMDRQHMLGHTHLAFPFSSTRTHRSPDSVLLDSSRRALMSAGQSPPSLLYLMKREMMSKRLTWSAKVSDHKCHAHCVHKQASKPHHWYHPCWFASDSVRNPRTPTPHALTKPMARFSLRRLWRWGVCVVWLATVRAAKPGRKKGQIYTRTYRSSRRSVSSWANAPSAMTWLMLSMW